MAPLKGIGYWSEPSLAPELWVSPATPQVILATLGSTSPDPLVLSYLRGGHVFERWRGWSWCRLRCGVPHEEMGHTDLTDGAWVWQSRACTLRRRPRAAASRRVRGRRSNEPRIGPSTRRRPRRVAALRSPCGHGLLILESLVLATAQFGHLTRRSSRRAAGKPAAGAIALAPPLAAERQRYAADKDTQRSRR